jgi:hypothetical protein
MQPERELDANKSKENQINPSKKACISLDSLGRIGAFQGVTTNPNKKIPRPRRGLRQVVLNASRSFTGLKSFQLEIVTHDFYFCK